MQLDALGWHLRLERYYHLPQAIVILTALNAFLERSAWLFNLIDSVLGGWF
jgi:hypothetical protein